MNTRPDTNLPQDAGSDTGEIAVTLGVLSAIEANSAHSQRSLAGELGIALGLANAYLKRCVRKGWIKVQQVPANRYAYYLTPQGFSEKARLTGEYLAASLSFFRRAREQTEAVLHRAATRKLKRLVLAGASELAEISILAMHDSACEIVAIVDTARAGHRIAGIEVVPVPPEARQFDAVLITDMTTPQATHDYWVERIGAEHVLAVELLRISHRRADSEEAEAAP